MLTRRQVLGGARVNVASAVVHSLPGRRDALRGCMAALPGVEIHAETGDGRFVVSVEDTAGASAGDSLLALHRLPDALAVALIAHYETE